MTYEVKVLYINCLLASILQKKGIDGFPCAFFKPTGISFYSTIQITGHRVPHQFFKIIMVHQLRPVIRY